VTRAEKRLRKIELAFPDAAAELTRRREERLAVEDELQAHRELVVLGLRDAGRHGKEIADLEAKLAAATEAEERAAAIVAGLAKRGKALADEIKNEQIERAAAGCAAAASRVAAIESELAQARAVATEAVERLAGVQEWQPPSFAAAEEAREAAEIARRDRAEAVDWWARSFALSPEKWPNHLREEIGARIDQLQAESESLEAARLDAASIAEEVAARSSMPSARVHARVLETPSGFFDRLDLFIASARGSPLWRRATIIGRSLPTRAE
jgi:hypothetical protein